MHFDRGKRKQKKESENGIGERILKKRGYMEKHYQIIRIQKLNNFITDRLQMSKKKNNDEQNQTNVWLAREKGCFGPEAPAPPPAAVTTRIIVQSPQLLGKKAHSLREGRERDAYTYTTNTGHKNANIVFKRLSVKTATDR